MFKKILLSTSLLLAFPSLADNKIDQLTDWMQGHFDSSKQAKADKDFFEIHLNMKQIWPAQKEATWLYVEQAAAGYLDKPYRQRVYKVEQTDENQYASHVYLLPENETYIGAHNQTEKFDAITPADLKIKQGCTVYLAWDEAKAMFTGSTKADECKSTLRGASYATSKVMISATAIMSWDQGFNAENKQVWGAEKAGYVFDKSK